jgi:hypothetical protein
MTYLQGMAYELARELISSKIGNLSHAIGVEERNEVPNADLISELEAKIVALAKEREDLVPENKDQMRSVIMRYSRTGTFPQELAG